jgi:hypothetical protein
VHNGDNRDDDYNSNIFLASQNKIPKYRGADKSLA